MRGSINLSVKVALSSELTPMELGVYARCKAFLFQTGRKAFNVADFEKLGGEELVKSALEHLLELGYVVRNRGWFSLAKRPVASHKETSTFVAKLATSAERSKGATRRDGRYEQLREALLIAAKDTLGYKPSRMTYSTNGTVNKGSYRRILAVVDRFGATMDEFVWFVFQHDWSSIAQDAPNLRLLGSNSFLSSFESYLQNKDSFTGSDDIFDSYDNVFSVITPRGLGEMRAALKLKIALEDLQVSPSQFFRYAASIRWRAFDAAPPLTFLTSDRFVNQFRVQSGTQASRRKTSIGRVRSTYLGRILDRLRSVPKSDSSTEFEDYNWQVAEAIFEPMQAIVSKNGSEPQLVGLVSRTIDEKDVPTFGSYVVTKNGRFTPLAVYWIVYAAKYLETTFYSKGMGDWKDTIRDFSADEVDLRVLDMDL